VIIVAQQIVCQEKNIILDIFFKKSFRTWPKEFRLDERIVGKLKDRKNYLDVLTLQGARHWSKSLCRVKTREQNHCYGDQPINPR
jgi:hypothetical protein